MPAAKTETPLRASHTGEPASGGNGETEREALAAAETVSERWQKRCPRGREAGAHETGTRRGRDARGAEVGSGAREGEGESEMAIAMGTDARTKTRLAEEWLTVYARARSTQPRHGDMVSERVAGGARREGGVARPRRVVFRVAADLCFTWAGPFGG